MSKAAEIVTCNETADEFQKLYYEKFDKQRHTLNNMYTADAVLTWNGNVCKGKMDISNFMTNLPISSSSIYSVDAQPINEKAFNTQAMMICTTGTVRFTSFPEKEFAQTFILHKIDTNIMKISYDCFRFMNDL